MAQFDDINAIRISLASPEQIKDWSYGEVTKAETINYRTLKPERDGLFCERIFGPVKDYECHCGKYKKIRYKGVRCDKCGVEVAHSSVRRERMGHIELAAPVTHIWFAKLVPCWLGILLDLSPKNLESVIYFARYLVTSVDEDGIEARARELTDQGRHEDAAKIRDLKPNMLLNEDDFRELNEKCSGLFQAGMGAESLLEVLRDLDIEKLHEELTEKIRTASRQQYDKLSKKLQLVEALRESGNRPEWMILTVLPVLPPNLRPVVQLDGGRFVISDLNDLYRRVINRNNRLRRLKSLGAPEAIIRNEKRMLQEAVDALMDNGRRGRVVTTGNNHALKSLSAMLAGKQGRFRQNLLGKRVDYSGRSVIVVGPDLKLHQCGIPRSVALELFKPFVMHKLMEKGFANNVKVARRQVERARPEVWDLLQEVVKERPVMLNRAPTLHRLSIQAFEPVLIDGDAFQLHPLVCAAFNADFDGDQMAVHVPLSKAAVQEVRERMLSVYNMLLPSNGMPVASPSLDIVLGCYYLTLPKPNAKGKGKAFASFDDAKLAYDVGVIELGAEIKVRHEGEMLETTVGRIIFNDAFPPRIGFQNRTMNKSGLRSLVSDCVRILGHEATAAVLDNLKQLGFDYATQSGVSISMSDIGQPPHKAVILQDADQQVGVIRDQYERGFITEDERYEHTVQVWMEATDKIQEDIANSLDRYGPIYMMATSGSKGNMSQIRQMAGMRGLMTDPSGRIIDYPIKASFREGLTPMEYFVSTHGARKGLADTALRTSESGYLTRRLVDVSQDVIVTQVDCGSTEGTWVKKERSGVQLPSFGERMLGYLAASPITDPATGEVLVARNEEIDEEKVRLIIEAGIDAVYVRSPLNCRSRFGICQYCYGRDLATRNLAKLGTAVGVIAAQSVGEPGTQLTLRTFHTGGVVGSDITTGLPRVEELFEARAPKGRSVLATIAGVVEVIESEEGRIVKVTNSASDDDVYPLPAGAEVLVADGQAIDVGVVLFREPAVVGADGAMVVPAVSSDGGIARVSGRVFVGQDALRIRYTETDEREHAIPTGARLIVENGDTVAVGQQLSEGVKNPHQVLFLEGKEETQQYIIDEIQKVYVSQGVSIHDKHIATILRQMFRRVEVLTSGDTSLLPGELVDRFDYEEENARYLAEGGEPATAQAVLLGITRASLNNPSWLAAASFQETNRVLAAAALRGKVDRLRGLKENVILGKLIPSQGMPRPAPMLIGGDEQREEEPVGTLSEY